jgi:hypothetical protein
VERRILKGFLLTLSLLIAIRSYARLEDNPNLSMGEKVSIHMEQTKNAVAPNRTLEIQMEHFEIPIEAVTVNMDERRISRDILNDLIFTKKVNGQDKTFVRWIINPEDTKYSFEVERYLKSKNLDATRYRYFTAYQQASRSWYCIGTSCKVMSLKVSTDKTGGNWVDKKQPIGDTNEVRVISDYVMAAIKKHKPKNFVFMDEPLAFTLPEIDQGMLLRLPGDLVHGHGGRRYVPAFSALHEEEGRRIAIKNGAAPEQVADFWNTHLNKPLARALAELFVMTGQTLDSPHGQNFMVELDKNEKPTGRVILKDLGDSYLLKEYFEAVGRTDITNSFYQENVLSRYVPVAIGLLHGNSAPSWLSLSTYGAWGQDFFKEFNLTVSQLTNIPVEQLIKDVRINTTTFGYHQGHLAISVGLRKFLDELKASKGFRGDTRAMKCRALFQ